LLYAQCAKDKKEMLNNELTGGNRDKRKTGSRKKVDESIEPSGTILPYMNIH
jgi:hypothetical protein